MAHAASSSGIKGYGACRNGHRRCVHRGTLREELHMKRIIGAAIGFVLIALFLGSLEVETHFGAGKVPTVSVSARR